MYNEENAGFSLLSYISLVSAGARFSYLNEILVVNLAVAASYDHL